MKEILEQWGAGLITCQECIDKLAALNIHGAITRAHYVGYDYTNQCWIDSNEIKRG